MILNLFNETNNIIDQDIIRETLEANSEIKPNNVVDLFIVDERQMSELHQKWMQTYEPTDVLSFPLEKDTSYPDDVIRLGDIVVCYPVAVKQGDSVASLAHHGLLHLLGHHHE